MDTIIILQADVDTYAFSSIEKMHEHLLHDGNGFTEEDYRILLEDHCVQTEIMLYFYDEYRIDEGRRTRFTGGS